MCDSICSRKPGRGSGSTEKSEEREAGIEAGGSMIEAKEERDEGEQGGEEKEERERTRRGRAGKRKVGEDGRRVEK
tara:strand:- start:126 stop:353 length:228 start_codon:yes stop_codon:yes gene_type:complete